MKRKIRKTYEEAVETLTERIYESMDFDAFKEAVENGLRGVRQMSNEQLVQEWQLQCDEQLEITDPEANPYQLPLEERL